MPYPARIADRLLDVIRELSFCRNIQSIMDLVRREARALTAADGVTFVLRDNDQCYYAEEDAIGPLWKGRRFPMRTCISGWVMQNRQTAAIEDIYVDPRIPIDAYRPTFVKSLAMVPVRAEDPLAAIGAYWATRHRASEQELRVLQSIADATALALANVELYENLQDALRRAEALNRAKDEWISVVSHELRTPLTPILGWARMLRGNRLGEDKRAHALEVIERSVMAEIRIVEDLLDVSRFMVGNVRVDLHPVNLGEVVYTAIGAVRQNAEEKSLTFDVSRPDAAVSVLGDAVRLQQAICNLLWNAIKFTPAGGRVTVRLVRENEHASVIVEDSGCGIPEDVIPRIFQVFERADSSTTRRNGGLGLGLFIVRAIAEMHAGSVTAQSDGDGRGATFAIHLPVHDATPARPALVEHRPPSVTFSGA